MKLLDSLSERFGLNAYALGRFERAEKWFRRLEKTEPDSVRVLRNLGVIRLACGDLPGAESFLKREEELYGESWARHRALADLAYASGKREEAARRYAAALSDRDAAYADGPEFAFIRARLALCRDEATFAPTRTGAKRFAAGEAARENGDQETALAAFLEAAELDGTNWPAVNNAGVILLARSGGAAEALELFRKAAACARIPMIERNIALARDAVARDAVAGEAVRSIK